MEPQFKSQCAVRTALIVDDDTDALALLSRYLEPLGFHSEFASSGRDALACVESRQFDLVISDVRMPNGTGIDLLREIRRQHEGLPIILISAATQGAKAQAKAMGAAAFLSKPISKSELAETISKLIQNQEIQEIQEVQESEEKLDAAPRKVKAQGQAEADGRIN